MPFRFSLVTLKIFWFSSPFKQFWATHIYPFPFIESSIMQNDKGEYVDLYIPRKWYVAVRAATSASQFRCYTLVHGVFLPSSSTNRIISAKDHASIQLNLVEVCYSRLSTIGSTSFCEEPEDPKSNFFWVLHSFLVFFGVLHIRKFEKHCITLQQWIFINNKRATKVISFQLDSEGKATGKNKAYCICGEVRRMGESDDSIARLAKRDGLLSKTF